MAIALKIAALFVVAVTMALSLAHALELPGKMRLTREQYLAVQPIYYPGFTYAGACEPIAVLALAVLLIVTPGSVQFWLIVGAFVAAALTHILYWTLTAPVNKAWLKDTKLSSGAQRFFGADNTVKNTENWTALRDRWERSHVLRAGSSTTAFVLLAIAVSM